MSGQNEWFSKAEDFADMILRRGRPIFPTIARICLCSTLIEDGFRMITQFSSQASVIGDSWGGGMVLGSIFVLINMIVQLGASAMIIIRLRVVEACYALFAIVILQDIVYLEWFETSMFLKSVGLLGGVLMLYVEAKATVRSSAAGLPEDDRAKPSDYMQLAARILLALMTSCMLSFKINAVDMFFNVVYLALMIMVFVGYKTKISCLVFAGLACWTALLRYNFWSYWQYETLADYLKYKFFQTLSCVGAFLMTLLLGPGSVSLDEFKKRE